MREETATVCFEVLRNIREEAVAREIRTVGFLGDWWHLRYTVPVRLLNAVADELHAWEASGVNLVILPGNHDQIDVHGRNALEVFSEFRNVKVYTEPAHDEWGLWIPYRHDLQDVRDALAEHMEGGLPGDNARGAEPDGFIGCVYYHGPIKGALMNNLVRAEVGLDSQAFTGYRRIIMGHFHKRQRWDFEGGFAQYIGSPWETKADEAGQPKGFAIFDGNELTFEDRQWGPKHHKLVTADPEEVRRMLQDVGLQDKVRVIVPEGGDLSAIAKLVGEHGVCNSVVEPAAIENRAPRMAAELAGGFRDHALRYVEATAGELDSELLMKTFDELTA
jgi:DNA repair exonuclease SbcCD nuclease subunit